MLCNSCNAEIPPAFVKAIKVNICPACDGPIMSDQTIELMAGLKSALEQMPNDAQGIAGWLLSNYRMEKVGTGEPTGFYGISKTPAAKDQNNLKQAKNPVHKFLKNAGIDPNKQKDYALLAAQINAMEEGNESEPEEIDDSVEDEDPEFTKQAMRTMISPNINKSQMPKFNEPEIDESLDGLHPALHADRLKRLEKQKELSSFGGTGIIKRS